MDLCREASWNSTGTNTADSNTYLVDSIKPWCAVAFRINKHIGGRIIHKALVLFSDLSKLVIKDGESFSSFMADP